jgi:phosphohistidine phosphatase
MQLILVRHAKAFERNHGTWPDDGRRPLTEEGSRAFRIVAKRLGEIAPAVDRVETSSFERARATAEILHEFAGWPRPERAERLEPAGETENQAALSAERTQSLMRSVVAMRALPSVAWVGHEPILSAVASLFLAGKPNALRLDFRKGAALAIEFDELTSEPTSCVGRGRLLWMVTPKVVKRIRGKS